MRELHQYITNKYPRFGCTINVAHITGEQRGVLLADFTYRDKAGKTWVATAPMYTDGGTFWRLPRLTRYITGAPWGKYLAAFIIHDYLCLHPEICSRKRADKLVYEMVRYLGANIIAARLLYRGVRIGAALGIGVPKKEK